MLIINFEGREVKGLSKGRYDETFAGEDGRKVDTTKPSLVKMAYSMSIWLLTEHHFEFLCLKGGYTGSSESTLVKMPHIVGNHMPRLNYVVYLFFIFCPCFVKLLKLRSWIACFSYAWFCIYGLSNFQTRVHLYA